MTCFTGQRCSDIAHRRRFAANRSVFRVRGQAHLGKGGIDCIGTGFLLNYDTCGYIVTARHLAHGLGNNPFLFRVNRKDGTSENIPADGVRWYKHPAPDVDVAVTPFAIGGGPGAPYDILYLPDDMMATDAIVGHKQLGALGVGDFTYTIGLFRLMSGERRNLPIVHFAALVTLRAPCGSGSAGSAWGARSCAGSPWRALSSRR
jgi:hypothetical protein